MAVIGDVQPNTLRFEIAKSLLQVGFVALTPTNLTGTTWRANGINNGRGGVESLVSGTTVTAIFGTDGTVRGSAGCNTFNGGYQVSGASIRIGPLASTRMACSPEAIMTQEQAYLAVYGKLDEELYAQVAQSAPGDPLPVAIWLQVSEDATPTRPEGSGRNGRSRRSCSMSKKSFQTMPPQYRQPEARSSSANGSQRVGSAPATSAPRRMSANAVKTLGSRTSWA